MNRQSNRDNSRPKTRNVSINSNQHTKNPRKTSQKRTISTARDKTINTSKEKPKRNNFYKNGNDMLSPKTIEYSKIAKKFGDILQNNNSENNYSSNYQQHSSNLIEKNKGDKKLQRKKSNSSDEGGNSNNYNNNSNDTNEKQSRIPLEKKEALLKCQDGDKSKMTDLNKKKLENITSKIKTEINTNRIPNTNSQTQNYTQYIQNILKENELLKEENLLLRKQLELEKNNNNEIKSSYSENENSKPRSNLANASQLEKLKNLIDNVEKENEELKELHSDAIQKAEDKIKLFLKLCRKYTQKIKNLMILYSKIETHNLNSLSESRDTILLELNETIEKFNKTIYHPRLVSKLIEFNQIHEKNTKKLFEEQYEYSIDDGYLASQLNLLETIKNLEIQIKKLSEENNQANKKKNEIDTIKVEYMNNLANKSDEIKLLKKKISDEKFAREEILTNLNSSKQVLKDTERKNFKLEEENSSAKKSLRIANEMSKDFELLKNNNINLSNEIKYKESLINYLESILEDNNIIYSKIGNLQEKNFSFKKKIDSLSKQNKKVLMTDNSSENELDAIGNNYIRKDESNLKINFLSNDREYSSESKKYNSQCNTENDNLSGQSKEYDKEIIFSSGRNSNIKNEIENLDDEIKHLQTKLKTMIVTGKK